MKFYEREKYLRLEKMDISEYARAFNRIHFVIYIGIVAVVGIVYNLSNQESCYKDCA